MRILGISVDEPAKSREFAKSYELPFPLIEDREKRLVKAYMGVDVNGFSLPGVVVIEPDRRVALRQVGESPRDRIYAGRLLEIVDGVAVRRGLDKNRRPRVIDGFDQLDKINLRLGGSIGLAQQRATENELGFSAGGSLVGLYPMNRHLMLGALVRGLAVTSTRIDLDLAVRLRMPALFDVGEIYAQVPIGATLSAGEDDTPHQGTGWNGGLAVGMQFSPKPAWAVFLELEGTYHRFAGRGAGDALAELRFGAGAGVCFLF